MELQQVHLPLPFIIIIQLDRELSYGQIGHDSDSNMNWCSHHGTAH